MIGTIGSFAPWNAQIGTWLSGFEPISRFAAAADRHGGRESIRVRRREPPRAVASHAEAGDIDAVGIDVQFVEDVINELNQLFGLPGVADEFDDLWRCHSVRGLRGS